MVSVFFPLNYQWDLAANIAVNSKAPHGEVFRIANLIADASAEADLDVWHDAWVEVAARHESLAIERERAGALRSASESFRDASVFYQVGERVLEFHDDRKLDLFTRAVACFERSLALRSPRARVIGIPYEGTTLRAYFLPAELADDGDDGAGPDEPQPCVFWFDGFDLSAEILTVRAEDLCRRGLHMVVVDGPGYGWALRVQGLATRYDYEAVAEAVVDHLETMPEIDTSRLGLAANSMGGYYAPRAATFEKRIRAVAAWGAMHDFHWYLGKQLARGRISADDPASAPFSQALKVFGVDTPEEALRAAEDFKLDPIIGQLTCSLLVVHGENDQQVPVDQARRTYEGAGSEDKTLVIVPRGTPGEEHCQWDNIVMAQHPIFDWFATRLTTRRTGERQG